MLKRLSGGKPPLRLRAVMLTAALYAPVGLLAALPSDGVRLDEMVRVGCAYVVVVYVASTAWFARRQGTRWVEGTARHVASAAAWGAVASGLVAAVASAAGLEHVYPTEFGMRFTIQECDGCQSPLELALRVIWFEAPFVVAAAALSPLFGAVGRALRRTGRGTSEE